MQKDDIANLEKGAAKKEEKVRVRIAADIVSILREGQPSIVESITPMRGGGVGAALMSFLESALRNKRLAISKTGHT